MALARSRAWIVCLIVAAASPGAMASTASDIAELVNVETTNQRRDALVDTLSIATFHEVAPRILPLKREYATPQEPGMGATPWMNDDHSVRARTWYALGAIWQRQISGPVDPKKAATLRSLLETQSHPEDKYALIQAIGHHWTAASERPLAALAKSRSETALTRVAATGELLRWASIDRYVPTAVALVRELPPSERNKAYLDLTNLGDPIRSIRPENLAALVDLGFEVLETEDPGAAYFLALRIGLLLDAPGEFKPDSRDPQYQGPNGLTQEYFDQTVRNALAWRKANPPARR